MTLEVQVALGASLSDAYASAFSYVYYAAIAVGSTAVLASLCVKEYDKYLNSHIPRQIYTKEEQKISKAPDKIAHTKDVDAPGDASQV